VVALISYQIADILGVRVARAAGLASATAGGPAAHEDSAA
jgi:hypothetical protein